MRAKELEKIMKFGKSSGPLQNQAKRKFFDQILEQQGPTGQNRRDRKRNAGLLFIEQGTYVKRGELMRRKQAQAELELDPLANFSAQLGGMDQTK